MIDGNITVSNVSKKLAELVSTDTLNRFMNIDKNMGYNNLIIESDTTSGSDIWIKNNGLAVIGEGLKISPGEGRSLMVGDWQEVQIVSTEEQAVNIYVELF